jgi:hypothetical protein
MLRLVGQESPEGTPSLRRDDGPHSPSPMGRGRIGAAVVVLGILLVLVGATGPVRAQGTQTSKPGVTDVVFDPAAPQSGDKLKVRMKLQNAVRAEVKWSLNGEDAGMSDYDGFADGVDFTGTLKTGDKVVARVTPFNEMAVAGAVVEKKVTCTKAPPSLKLVSQEVKGGVYRAKIDVIDQEKNSLTLSVEGPQGMKIEQDGNISWSMGNITSGKWPIKVVAKDPKGAEAVLTWTIGLRKAK